jgi:hypothetical protein
MTALWIAAAGTVVPGALVGRWWLLLLPAIPGVPFVLASLALGVAVRKLPPTGLVAGRRQGANS